MITDSGAAVLEILTSKGWCFRDPDEAISFIQSKNPSANPISSSLLVDSIESELLNIDLRLFGGKSLPEPSATKKSSYLHGPKILQLVSMRDIRQSAIDSSFSSLQHQNRLLRFILTDGLSEIIAIEYTPVPGIVEEIIPGCKVCLQNKIVIHYGILCLNAGAITIMGGLVQSLYDEWQINRRYSGFSRSLMTQSRNNDGDGPPPFEKLQTDAFPREASAFSSSHGGRSIPVDDLKPVSSTIQAEEKTSRPKEVIEAVPVQNQAAAQKLLQKMSQPMPPGRNPRDHRTRFKGRQDEAPVFTLDEWERKKAGTSSSERATDIQDISTDEILARQLQSQLDFEDYQNRMGNSGSEAEQIRMSMFSFGGIEEKGNEGGDDFRGRGRGRSRGRGRGRKNFK